MKQIGITKTNLRLAVFGALLTTLASQINISLLTSDFNISVAIVLLPVFAFLRPSFPVFFTALLAAPGMFLLRIGMDYLTYATFANGWSAHAPEMIFYLSYGLLLSLYLKRIPLLPFRLVHVLPLAVIDACANFFELLLRLGRAVFDAEVLLHLLLVGAGRTLLAVAVIRTLDFYGFQVLRREDAERYQRLLLLTSTLKSEIAWMDTGTARIENTMSAAYHLYRALRHEGTDTQAAEALTIAKDIHEVKKEYFLIMRGITDALESDTRHKGMWLKDLFELMSASVQRTAAETHKQVSFTCDCTDNFHTTNQHYLMSVFHNLLSNAVEAAKPGVPAHISLLQRSVGDSVVFEIQDDCGGIPPTRAEQIFVVGFSSKINVATGELNRGLGLCIVKDLVEEKLLGELCVASTGGGTVFTIQVPKAELEGPNDTILSG